MKLTLGGYLQNQTEMSDGERMNVGAGWWGKNGEEKYERKLEAWSTWSLEVG
jgi:hypothetical protein